MTLSRVADSLYWMSRYLERAEHIARLVNVNLNLTLDRAPADAARHWGRLLASLPAPPPWDAPTRPLSLERAVLDLANREAIAACVGTARENARQVRGEISTEMWQEINRLYLGVQARGLTESEWTAGTHEFLTSVIEDVQLFQGVTDSTMTHSEGWHFIELGRYLERGTATASLLDVQFRECGLETDQVQSVSDYVEWVGLLKSCCAFEAYCRHYTADLRPLRIAEFLTLNPDFPRSVHFAMRRVHASLECIGRLTGQMNGEADRLAGRLLASLNYGTMTRCSATFPRTSSRSSGRQAASTPRSSVSTSPIPRTAGWPSDGHEEATESRRHGDSAGLPNRQWSVVRLAAFSQRNVHRRVAANGALRPPRRRRQRDRIQRDKRSWRRGRTGLVADRTRAAGFAASLLAGRMIRYGIRHVTRFSYDSEISESVMELRMQPASDGPQQCLQFELQVEPRARVFGYRDALGNTVHHFDLPGRHAQLSVTARSLVQVDLPAPLPDALPMAAWRTVDDSAALGEDWEFLQPSRFAEWSDSLIAFADSLGSGGRRTADPLTTVRDTMAAIHERFDYAPRSTRVDSPIDEALSARRGVCQDFTHIMLAVLRRWRLPCRYVSGYIAPDTEAGASDRARSASLATHAWVEVALPELGWIGVDPTNNIGAGPRHVRVAIGRDYADVPPTRGIFKGGAGSELSVSVTVSPSAVIPAPEPASVETSWVAKARPLAPPDAGRKQQQQQQQQQR